MTRRRINRLPGMVDVMGRDHDVHSEAVASLKSFLSEAGYGPIDTPLLEDTELFVRKSGGELTSRLYTFTEPGGRRVSLRPEFTSSVIRYFINEVGPDATPFRCHYSGPVFRYEPGDASNLRQFTQVGAELVGTAGTEADAEMLAVAWNGLRQIGLEGHRLRIGHLGSIHDLLDRYALSELAKLFAIGRLQELKDGSLDAAGLRQRAEGVGLLSGSNGATLRAAESEGIDEAAVGFIKEALSASMPSSLGSRTAEEIITRMLRKARRPDDGAIFEEAVEAVSRLVQLEGAPDHVIEAANRVVEGVAGHDHFKPLESLVEALNRKGIGESDLVLDMGMVRGIAYYTGAIFEITAGDGRSLGGGGRYDGLVRALGGDEDVPALGFAYSMDRVVEWLTDRTEFRARVSP